MALTPVPDTEEEPPEPTPTEVEATVYSQPSVRTLQTWTPEKIRQAEFSADAGVLDHAAELVDALLADEILGGAIETRAGGLQGLPLSFEDGRGDEAGDSPLAPELTEDWGRAYSETDLKQLASWGLVLGVGFAEQVWEVNANGRFAPRLRIWHPEHFRWNRDIERWCVRTGDFEEVIIHPNGPKWIVYTPYGEFRPWARGLWRGLARWWMLKEYAISDWGLHGEQASRTVIEDEGMNGLGATDEVRKQLSADLKGLGKDSTIVMPAGFKFSLVEAKADTRDIYGAQVEMADAAIVIAINGQNLTTSVQGGSLAAASVHERVEARRLRSDGETLSTTIRSQSLIWWTLWNFGESAVPPWPRWETDPPESLESKAEVLNTTADALVKLQTAGLEVVDLDELSQDYGLPKLKKVEGAGDVETAEESDGNGDADSSDGDSGGSGAGDSSSGGGDQQARQQPAQTLLASGLPTAQAGGFVEGQTYADSLTDWGALLQARDFREGFVKNILKAIDAGDNYAEIRAAVKQAFNDEAPPEEMASIIERLFIMANRAGEVAVDQDS